MCGINGIVGYPPEKIFQMNESLKHRGPDGDSYFKDEKVAIGHTLLSIRSNDLKGSTQPFSNINWALCFNGEIYNIKEITKKFSLKQSDLDTDILFQLVNKVGLNFIKYIHGMYAICLYDKKSQKIYLFRDQSGQKSIFYTTQNKNFAFSSEIAPILNLGVDKRVNEKSLSFLNDLGYIPAPYSIFKNIFKVLPSERIEFDLTRRTIRKKILTEYESDFFKLNPDQAITECVKLHIQSKKKLGINLSGGLDSSIILHEASKNDIDIFTYTQKFETQNKIFNEESILAKKLSKDYKTKHREIYISEKLYKSNLIESHWILEEPNYNLNLSNTLIAAKIQGIQGDKNRVLLLGDGGDEVFGGYTYYYERNQEVKRYLKFMPFPIYNLLKYIKNKNYINYKSFFQRWHYFRSMKENYLKTQSNNISDLYFYDDLSKIFPQKNCLIHETMLMDRLVWLPSENFHRGDKIFMNQSIENRSPLSYFPLNVVFDKKLRGDSYLNKKDNKIFIRQLYQNKLPDYIINRSTKWGYRPPWIHWFAGMKNFILELFINAQKYDEHVNWEKLIIEVNNTTDSPSRSIQSYLSYAILLMKYNKVNISL
ncbi:asparagine synthase (glutamine-hydrolyzing) [Bacteriovoracales bacterium]|nr:asparagine synthase (glutamine-hydrolyzing) [Bacteriovoracales bacterium]